MTGPTSHSRMATGFATPSMNWEAANLPDEFSRFRQYVQLIFDGPFSLKTEKEKSSYLLIWIGRAGVDVFNSWSWDNQDDRHKLSELWQRFETHIKPMSNARLARFQLQQFRQAQDETVDSFITRCKNQGRKCKFADTLEFDERVIEQLIVGTQHGRVQEKLIELGDTLASLDAAVAVARNYEATQTQLKELCAAQPQASVNAVGNSKDTTKQPELCSYCGRNHAKKRESCPAYGQTCRNCDKANHWAEVCRRPKTVRADSGSTKQPQYHSHSNNVRGNPAQSKRHVNTVEEELESLIFESINLDGVTSTEEPRDQAFVTLELGQIRKGRKSYLTAKVDTGAQGNVLPLRIFAAMFPDSLNSQGTPIRGILQPSPTRLTAYGGSALKQFGICSLRCSFNGRAAVSPFYVTEATGPAIVGLPTLEALRIVTVNCAVSMHGTTGIAIRDKDHLVRMYPSCFDGIGKFKGQYHITTDPNVPPVIHNARRAPISMKEDIKKELEDMENQKIIQKVREGEPTRWVNSLVYRRKGNGRLRICLDPKDLNKAILREHHVTPTLEETLPKFHGAQVFSILDAKSGYWNVELDEESNYITTFNSPFGRYRFLRMPFGLRMSQDVF